MLSHVIFIFFKNHVIDHTPFTILVSILIVSTGFSNIDSELMDDPMLFGRHFFKCDVSFFLKVELVP